MDVFIALLFVLGLMYPSSAVMANDLPALVRIVRQQNKLPMETTVPTDPEDSEPNYDDEQSVRDITQHVPFINQAPQSKTIETLQKQSLVSTTAKPTVQIVKSPVQSQTASQSQIASKPSSKPSAPNPNNPSKNISSTLPPTASTSSSQQKSDDSSKPIPIVLNVNVLVHSESEKHPTECADCNHQTKPSPHKCQSFKSPHIEGSKIVKNLNRMPKHMPRQNIKPIKIQVPIKMKVPIDVPSGNEQYYGHKAQAYRKNN
uniref:Uncharacterized protein n=1 Tax=Anopheles funestus TaxID=62324 RepID=A0A182R594_ANOFN